MNKVKCMVCATILISKSVHDFQQCDCLNATFTDGGDEYQRYGGVDLDKIMIMESPNE